MVTNNIQDVIKELKDIETRDVFKEAIQCKLKASLALYEYYVDKECEQVLNDKYDKILTKVVSKYGN